MQLRIDMKTASVYFSLFTIIILFLFSGCKKDDNEDTPVLPDASLKVNSCEGCHTNYDHLKEVYTPDPPDGGGAGCGGDIPHYEPYDRVYLGGDGYTAFKSELHGKISCVTCHNGVDGTSDKDEAHSGNFLKKPTSESEEKCGSCHPNIVNRTKNSLHEQGWGQKNMVVGRSGYGNHPTEFDNLPELMKEGYDVNCAKCHGTCGECHIVRPKQMGGGLSNGHQFIKTPDMRNVCVGCHVSRGGHAYLGVAPGTKPDVHLTDAGFNSCMFCHSKDEIHGDGNIYDTRYKMPLLPRCETCHPAIDNANLYHSTHIETFNCYTCHSQDYNNCGSCHIHGEGARIPSHQKFKIAMNPIPEIKPYKLATVRQSLSAPDSWKEYGIDNLANFDFAPTYKYTTPHNILRWTERTNVDTVYDANHPECAQACHIVRKDDGTIVNKEFYLFEENLEDWEIDADRDIVVDGRLPSGWDIK
jgi:thiosulfate/3-mercaptopyruvate sulfurtransferase